MEGWGFLSTLPQGERPLALPEEVCCRIISIHAPARGATLVWPFLAMLLTFLSTLPQGERLLTLFSAAGGPVFLSTLPQGERLPGARMVTKQNMHFYPRSRKGSD